MGLILCGSKGQQVVELLLSGPGNRVKVAQYLLLDSEDALKQHLAPISAAYEQLQGDPAGHADPNAESGLGVGRRRRRVGVDHDSQEQTVLPRRQPTAGHAPLKRSARILTPK